MNLVKVYNLETHIDDRGLLYEILRTDADFKPKMNQVYLVKDRTRGIIRAFHKHEELWDYFHIAAGSATFFFFKDIDSGFQKVVLDSRKPQVIAVPPTIWHGWMNLEDNTILVSVGSTCYNAYKPDEERCKPDVLGDVWKVEAK